MRVGTSTKTPSHSSDLDSRVEYTRVLGDDITLKSHTTECQATTLKLSTYKPVPLLRPCVPTSTFK